MIKATIMEFDASDRIFKFLREMNLFAMPSPNDKVVIDFDGIGYIFNVYDVHFAESGFFEVNVVRLGTITDYYSNRFPDIK